MTGRGLRTGAVRVALVLTAAVPAGCSAPVVAGTATWPGEILERQALSASDVAAGAQYDRITEQPGQPDGAGAPGPLLSRPEGCTNALTNVIAQSAERGPGSAVKYSVIFDGARIVMTVLSWKLDMNKLRAQGERCANFEAFFDPQSDGIPITTTDLAGLDPDALAYQQTMRLGSTPSSVYMAFQNVGDHGTFGIAFPAPNPGVTAKAELPQTFLDLFTAQVAKMRSS